jgi:hypothetical protein
MKTLVTTAKHGKGEAAAVQLTDGDLAVAAGGFSLGDFILPKVKPRDPPPVLLTPKA